MKPALKLAAITVCMAGMCALFVGCGNSNGNNSSNNNVNNNNSNNNTVGGVSGEFTEKEFYGVGAVSCVGILGSSVNAQSAVALASLAAASDTDGEIREQAESFNKYFAALNTFLDDSALTVETKENTDAGYSQFAIKLIVKGKDIAGNSTEYVMYYNETFVSEKVGDGETESKYSLEGVMLADGNEYRLTGGKEIETEDGEREEELKIRAYTGAATGDFVEMKQEHSVEDNETETEYVYRIYSDNKLVEETSVEFETETENGKTETEFELEFRKGGAKGKYKVEREVTGGVTEISVKYNLDGKQGKFKIREVVKDGKAYYEYTFEEGGKALIEK